MGGFKFHFISLLPSFCFEIRLQILVHCQLTAEVEAPGTGSSSAKPRTTWAMPCNSAQWCGFMNRPATHGSFLRKEWIFILHLLAFEVAVFFYRLYGSGKCSRSLPLSKFLSLLEDPSYLLTLFSLPFCVMAISNPLHNPETPISLFAHFHKTNLPSRSES